MIGLTERGTEYEARGYSGRRQALGYRSFRHRGMPFAVEPREGMHGTWPMCRAIVAARLTVPEREWAVFRALQVAQFTTTLNLETTEGIAAALQRVPGLDVARLLADADSPETEAAFARRPRGGPLGRRGPDLLPGQGGHRPRRSDPLHGAEPRVRSRRRPRAWRPAASSRSRPTTC